jgi:WhiB family redox-sensing transcriptional regulator
MTALSESEEPELDQVAVRLRATFTKEWSVMYNVTRAPDWEGANCTSTDPEVFFLEKGFGNGYQAAKARAICKDCPLRIPCLNYALDNRFTYGIWGGMSYRERLEFQKVRAWANQTE